MLFLRVCVFVCVRWGEGVRGVEGGEENTFNIFFFYKMTWYIIPYSFSQQNEFYKVL